MKKQCAAFLIDLILQRVLHNSVMNITGILAGLKSDYIHRPFDEYRETALSFQSKSRFPGSICLIVLAPDFMTKMCKNC